MEDADGILFLSLRQAGCPIPEDATTVADFSPNTVVAVCVSCLRLINGQDASQPGPDDGHQLPKETSARFRFCNNLTVQIQQLGFRGELSFHQFLYPSEQDTRVLLRFLVDKLSEAAPTAGGAKGRRTGRRGGSGFRRRKALEGSVLAEDEEGQAGVSARTAVVQALGQLLVADERDGRAQEGSTRVQGQGRERGGTEVQGEETAGFRAIPFQTIPLRVPSVSGADAGPPGHGNQSGGRKKGAPLITLQTKSRALIGPSVIEHNSMGALLARRTAEAHAARLAAEETDPAGRQQADETADVITWGNVFEPSNVAAGSPLESQAAGLKNREKDESRDGRSRQGDEGQALSEETEEMEGKGREEAQEDEANLNTWQREVEDLQTELENLIDTTDQLASEAVRLQSKRRDLHRQLAQGEATVRQVEDEAQLMERAAELLLAGDSSAEETLARLERAVEGGEARRADLEAEWEEVKGPLEAEKTKLQEAANEHRAEEGAMLQRVREMREERRAMAAQMHDREEEQLELGEAIESAPKSVSRAVYLRRMTDIIKNIKKQDAGIAVIIADTRALQRESNLAQERLQRTHALVDEMIFRDAKKDPVCRQAYRLLSSIHESFGDLSNRVAETNRVGREIAELDGKLEVLSKRQLETAGVQADLDTVRAENRALARRIEELRASLQ